MLQTLKKMLKWCRKKDISSILVWNPLTMSMTMTMGGNKNVTNSERDAKMLGKKDISSISVWNPLTRSMTITMTMGGSKNITNSEKGAKIV